MFLDFNEDTIRQSVIDRNDAYSASIMIDPFAPSGKLRTLPYYSSTIANQYLHVERKITGTTREEVKTKVLAQIAKWKQKEIKMKISEAKAKALADAIASCERESENAKAIIGKIENLLVNSIKNLPTFSTNVFYCNKVFQPFIFDHAPCPPLPPRPTFPKSSEYLKRSYKICKQEYDQSIEDYEKEKNSIERQAWRKKRDEARRIYKAERSKFLTQQDIYNKNVPKIEKQYHKGCPIAISLYIYKVLNLQIYPKEFQINHDIIFDSESQMVVVDVFLPKQSAVPNVIGYRFNRRTGEMLPIILKPKEHNNLYDSAVKQSILLTLFIVLESTKTNANAVSGVVVNGWADYLNKATGTEKTTCIISVSTNRDKFSEVILERVDPTECIKRLKGLVAGPLSEMAPVQPVMYLNRDDSRFVESQGVLAEINSLTNIVDIGWEEFEHLVRDLFAEMFSAHGEEVRVTQSSRDGGVDAIAFDPDPIRGGKFIIQAKRYINVVPVSAVRDLYGTMISEGATKGILVTTAHFGPDSREFVKDKPISLIDGSNLVFLLEKYGHKVRIDVIEARRNMERNPLKR